MLRINASHPIERADIFPGPRTRFGGLPGGCLRYTADMRKQEKTGLVGLLAVIAACSSPPVEQGGITAAPEPEMTIRGSLAFRDGAGPPPGSVATITVGEFGGEAPDPVASNTMELESTRSLLPFELGAPLSGFDPSRQYAVSARVSGPGGATLWTTDVAQLIDPTRERVDVGILLMKRSVPDRGPDAGPPSDASQ